MDETAQPESPQVEAVSQEGRGILNVVSKPFREGGAVKEGFKKLAAKKWPLFILVLAIISILLIILLPGLLKQRIQEGKTEIRTRQGQTEMIISPSSDNIIRNVVTISLTKVPEGTKRTSFSINAPRVEFEKADQIGEDNDGSDGWSLKFDTLNFPNNEYTIHGLAFDAKQHEGARLLGEVQSHIKIQNEEVTFADANECAKDKSKCKNFCIRPENVKTCFNFCTANLDLCALLRLEDLTIKAPAGEIEYYKGTDVGMGAAWKHPDRVMKYILERKQEGYNIISIAIHYGVGEDGKPEIERRAEAWKPALKRTINFAHLAGLQVEINNSGLVFGTGGVDYYEGTPEQYIAGFVRDEKELAEIAEEHNIYQFNVMGEADHNTMQGYHHTIEGLYFSDDLMQKTSDWSKKLFDIVRERYHGRIGVAFGGTPPSLNFLDSLNIKGFDYTGFTYRADVFTPADEKWADYATEENVRADVIKTVDAFRGVADRNEIPTLLHSELMLEGEINGLSPLSSEKRRQFYNIIFQESYNKVNGFITLDQVSEDPIPRDHDEDLQTVTKEWFSKKL